MKYYFDVKETFIKTVCIEADNLEQAEARVQNAYKREEFDIDREYPDDVEFKKIDEEELLETEDIEEFDCHELVYDKEQDGYVCPVCNNFIVSRDSERDLNYSLPDCCDECGTELE